MRIFIVVFCINILLSACQEVAAPTEMADKPNIFFDIKGFFEKEKARLETKNSFKKTVSINSESETKMLSVLNLDNELSIFIASDINKPAWSDKYKVDSIYNSQKKLSQLSYSALDESLKTKKIAIDFQNQAVSKITIQKATDNAVAQSKQLLTYDVTKGYTIQSEQSLSLSETKTISVKVDF